METANHIIVSGLL